MPATLNEQTQFTDSSGKPLVSGKVYFGVQNADPTVSPITIFSDRELTVVISNPQILDALGRTTNKVWVPGRYSMRVDDLNDVQIYQELDNGESSDVGVTILENVSGANTITATAASTITVYEDKEQYTFTVAQVNTTAVTLNIDGVGAKSITKNHDQAILPGDFEEDQIVIVSYNSTDDVFEWVNQNLKTMTFYEGTPVATATAPDIWVTDGNTFHFTGTTTVVDFADAPNIGARRTGIADAGFTLTHGSGIILEGSANIAIAAGDRIEVYADAVDAFRAWVTKANGEAVTSVAAFEDELLHIQDQKAQNTAGGTFTSGARRTRDLNTVLTNQITGASLATNQITLAAGDYFIQARASAHKITRHQSWLRDTTGAADLVIGSTEHTSASQNVATNSFIVGRFTLSVESVLEIQHECSSTFSTSGFGVAANFSTNEVYTDVQIWKVG